MNKSENDIIEDSSTPDHLKSYRDQYIINDQDEDAKFDTKKWN